MNLLNKFKEFFTNSKVKELEEKIAQIQKNQIKDVLHPIKFEFKGIAEEKLIQKCIYNVGTKNIDVVFTDGDVISGVIEQYTYEQIRNATSKEEVLDLLIPKNIKGSDYDIDKEEDDIKIQIASIVSILSEIDDFEVVGKDVFLKGVKSIAIPSSIVAEFIRIVSEMDKNREKEYGLEYISKDADLGEEYNSLLMFTYKLLLNPLKESREQLLNFVKKNDVKITSYGNLVLYRACWEAKNESDALVKFVAKEYLKIKAWKKSPKNYWVNIQRETENTLMLVEDKIHELNLDGCLGNLAELYAKLPEMQSEGKQYYSDHGKKKIVIGDIYKIDDSEVNLDSGVCHSGGLHLAAVDYDYSGYGNTNLICLLNPSKTITVPSREIKKLRCSEMMVVGINPNERGVHIDEGFYSNLDENYHNYSLEVLQEALKNKSFEPISVSTEVTELSIKEVANVTDILRNRVVEIV